MTPTGKTPEEIRKTFNIPVRLYSVYANLHTMRANLPLQGLRYAEALLSIVMQNDFTPEEEEEVRRENQWCACS